MPQKAVGCEKCRRPRLPVPGRMQCWELISRCHWVKARAGIAWGHHPLKRRIPMWKNRISLAAMMTVLTVGVTPALAADFVCNAGFDVISGGTYQNVVVPDGGYCILTEATITGNISVGIGGALFIDVSTVQGNVEGT